MLVKDSSDSCERTESNLSFVRRKCDEWLTHGLPKLAQLQCSIDECDLIIDKEWQPLLTEQARTVSDRGEPDANVYLCYISSVFLAII